MPAVVRIKRRIDEEPHTAFVLNGKRRRLHHDENAVEEAGAAASAEPESDKDELTTVLKFAGTLEKQDDCATRQFAAARLNKASAHELVQRQRSTDATIATALRRERQRQKAQENAREERFRVVNCLRSAFQDDATAIATPEGQNQESQPSKNHITIVDIESQTQQLHRSETGSSANQEEQHRDSDAALDQQPADSDIGYVYDLYVPENEMQAAYVDMMDDNYLRVIPVGEIVLEDCYNDQDEDYDSEDSNQENYYTNDYPDDEEAGMGSDDDLCRQMNKFMLDDDENDPADSSEDEDYATYHDPYIHTVDTEADSFVDDVDFYNADRERGSAYERYKRRILRELEDQNDDEDDNDGSESFASADDE
ncbi:hypothetical protein KR038_006839 [Drosophila bunnanda]|nr:hypothetical protein KR038_006839 [Drosophila bunnanda]